MNNTTPDSSGGIGSRASVTAAQSFIHRADVFFLTLTSDGNQTPSEKSYPVLDKMLFTREPLLSKSAHPVFKKTCFLTFPCWWIVMNILDLSANILRFLRLLSLPCCVSELNFIWNSPEHWKNDIYEDQKKDILYIFVIGRHWCEQFSLKK